VNWIGQLGWIYVVWATNNFVHIWWEKSERDMSMSGQTRNHPLKAFTCPWIAIEWMVGFIQYGIYSWKHKQVYTKSNLWQNALLKVMCLTHKCKKQQVVCVTLWPCQFTFKSILRQKKNYAKLKYFTMQKYNLQNSFKGNQNPSRYYNSITNLKFQHKPKYHLSKILI
jgi:hypothetical protein